jgi:hypothetical protein
MNKQLLLPVLMGLFILMLFLDKSRRLEDVSSFFGIVGAILFIVANAYYPARLIAKKFKPWPTVVTIFFRKYLRIHIFLNLAAFLAVTIHAHYAEERNIFLQGCYLVTIFLTVEGLLMHYRVIPGMQKRLRMLHTQQTLFVVWILLIMIGHSLL